MHTDTLMTVGTRKQRGRKGVTCLSLNVTVLSHRQNEQYGISNSIPKHKPKRNG